MTAGPHPPVGDPLPDWQPPAPLGPVELVGEHCRVTPLRPEADGPALFAALGDADTRERLFTYLSWECPRDAAELVEVLRAAATPPAIAMAIRAPDGEPLGTASWLRDDPANGVVEVGSILLSPRLQRTTAATEAMLLMAERAFGVGYRRYEWKCDALNAPSRRAAERLGFTLEGVFRQAVVVKGRNRDTAWFSITDGEWARLRPAIRGWLTQVRHSGGTQRVPLGDLTRAAPAGQTPRPS